MSNLKRIYLLSEAEIEELYARPFFTQEEQALYFGFCRKKSSQRLDLNHRDRSVVFYD